MLKLSWCSSSCFIDTFVGNLKLRLSITFIHRLAICFWLQSLKFFMTRFCSWAQRNLYFSGRVPRSCHFILSLPRTTLSFPASLSSSFRLWYSLRTSQVHQWNSVAVVLLQIMPITVLRSPAFALGSSWQHGRSQLYAHVHIEQSALGFPDTKLLWSVVCVGLSRTNFISGFKIKVRQLRTSHLQEKLNKDYQNTYNSSLHLMAMDTQHVTVWDRPDVLQGFLPFLDDLTRLAHTVPLSSPKVFVGSTVLGWLVPAGDTSTLDATYFCLHFRQPVLFTPTVDVLCRHLSHLTGRCLDRDGIPTSKRHILLSSNLASFDTPIEFLLKDTRLQGTTYARH